MISERTLFSNPRTELAEQVLTTRSALATLMPVMWGFMGQAASEWTLPLEEVWQKSSLAFLVHGLICWSWPSVFAGTGKRQGQAVYTSNSGKNVLFCFTLSLCCRHTMLGFLVCHPRDAPDCACRNLFRFAVMFHARFVPDHWHQGFLETVMRPASAEWASMCRALACSSCLVVFLLQVNWWIDCSKVWRHAFRWPKSEFTEKSRWMPWRSLVKNERHWFADGIVSMVPLSSHDSCMCFWEISRQQGLNVQRMRTMFWCGNRIHLLSPTYHVLR